MSDICLQLYLTTLTTSIVNQLERLILKDIDLNNYRFHLVLSFLRKFACYDRCNGLKSLQFNSASEWRD